jgi:hypothetical protein
MEDAIDVHADTNFDPIVGETKRQSETADIEKRVALIGCVELNRRNGLLQPVHVEVARVFDLLSGQHRDWDWDFLGGFLDAARRHGDHFGQPTGLERNVERH